MKAIFQHGEKRYTPMVLHTSIDGMEREGSWHDKCMTDAFAKSLPKCKDCEEAKA